MKKILLFLLSALIAFTAAACAPANVVYDWEMTEPWGDDYERCLYDVKIYERVKSGEENVNGEVIAEGTLEYVLNIVPGTVKYADVTMKTTLVYKDTEKALQNRGLTDEAESTVRFANSGFASISSEKTVKSASRKNTSGKYTDTSSFKVTADYKNNRASAYIGQKVDTLTGTPQSGYKFEKEFALQSNLQYFDNEQLLYIIRALKTTKPESSTVINNSNIYDISQSLGKKDKYTPSKTTISTEKALVSKTVEPSIAQLYLSDDYKSTDGVYSVNCMSTYYSKAAEPKGPPFYLYISEPSAVFTHSVTKNVSNKIILEMKQIQYNTNTRTEQFHTIYTLKEYSNGKIH